MNIGVLVSGRGTNLQAIIDAVESGYIKAKISVVISSREDALALQRARDYGIEAVFIDPQDFWKDKEHREEKRVEYDKKIIAELERRKVDLVLLTATCSCSARTL